MNLDIRWMNEKSIKLLWTFAVCLCFDGLNYFKSAKWLFLENALKKTSEYFLKFLFFTFRLIMENNFIQMAGSAGHAVAYTIGSIFKHIIDCVQLYFTNLFTNIVL